MKRFAIVGTGGRYAMFLRALVRDYAHTGSVVALLDINAHRRKVASELMGKFGAPPAPCFGADAFDEMIASTRPDTVIVTSIDRTHHTYICRAMRAGCDVISEKPLTIDAEKCLDILRAQRETGRQLTVAFNYRYAPRNGRVKALLDDGVIGAIKSVHFEWLLDTRHGADYFRRWHRDKRNSGGLLVHKATHHFDLVNWWLDASPLEVYAMGDLVFYGRENAEARGMTRFYQRGTGDPLAADDPFALDLDDSPVLKRLYYDAEHEDGYQRDQNVFSDGISIEDDMSVLVRYDTGCTMTYHLTAYSPWEGYRVAFNGTGGRLEYEVHENSYVSGADGDANYAGSEDSGTVIEPAVIRVRPHWRKPRDVELDEVSEAGHGGGDERLLQDIFDPGGEPDPLGRAADHIDGARSILTGIAANRSIATGRPVRVRDLVDLDAWKVST